MTNFPHCFHCLFNWEAGSLGSKLKDVSLAELISSCPLSFPNSLPQSHQGSLQHAATSQLHSSSGLSCPLPTRGAVSQVSPSDSAGKVSPLGEDSPHLTPDRAKQSPLPKEVIVTGQTHPPSPPSFLFSPLRFGGLGFSWAQLSFPLTVQRCWAVEKHRAQTQRLTGLGSSKSQEQESQVQEVGTVHGAARGAQVQRGWSSPRPSTVPGQAQQLLPQSSPWGELKAVLSTQCLCSLCPDTKITARTPKARQLLQPSSRPRQRGTGTLAVPGCSCTLQGPNSQPLPPLAHPQQKETPGPSAGRGKSLLSLLGRRLPQALALHTPLRGSSNNSWICWHYQNTPQN